MRIRLRTVIVLLFTLGDAPAAADQPRFEVTIDPGAHAGPLTGRLIVAVSKRAEPEPRLQISPQGPAIFGMDLEQTETGRRILVDETAIGYPMPLAELPAGEYHVQALVRVYQQVRRSDGHTLWLPMNDGRIEAFQLAAGNLYSDVVSVRIEPGDTVRLSVSHVNPPAERAADSEWVKRVSIPSEKLSRFWGRPVEIHAKVLLPLGYEDHPDVRYPGIYALGHNVPFSFNTDSTRVRGVGEINPTTGLESGYDFYREWVSEDFPRVIAISLEQQTPYFPDSYSVNSANNGPYGDAMVEEVIPYLEEHFRIIRSPHARQLEGASTSGWQSLALILRNPDFFGGAWVLQPDPIDFTRYLLVDIYADENAFRVPAGQFTFAERPFRRTVEGQMVWTMRQLSLFEEVLGSRGRSGYQLSGWEAVYGPAGDDGYPAPLWNRTTGEIDHDVAESMRENGYDLRAHAERNWATLGPKLAGKLHFFAGDMDDFYLNLAVYRFEDFLKGATDPKSDAEFTYGRPMKGHSWHEYTWAELVRRIATAIRASAPPGDDSRAWNYD